MKKDNIFSIIIMCCGALLVLSVFLPYITYYSTSVSLWKMEDSSSFIYILLGIFVIALFLINKKTEMAYLASGYGTFTCISNILSIQGFNGLSIAFYLIFLSSMAIGVLTFLYDESEADALINLSVSFNKTAMSNNQVNNNQTINSQPQQTVIENQVTNNEIQQTAPIERNYVPKFDPMTGQPINKNENNN